MLLLAAITIALFALILVVARRRNHRSSLRLKCLCQFRSTTPSQDVGFIQALLHRDSSIEVSRVTRKLDGTVTVFEIEYATDRATQAQVLGMMRARESLTELRVLSGSGSHGNVIFMSRELSLPKTQRKELRVSRYASEHQPQRRRRY